MLLGMYLLDSTLKNRKTIEKERYELMESHIHYVCIQSITITSLVDISIHIGISNKTKKIT